ncbi:centrosomal protein of 131 kDa [Vespa velutina]|uniref:centrosomal protein of 131 kDa n=1 Tax=Vespa velutina TaxID=202808 RepID=UPI001FB2564C|nr:centrosomal protein of 131 kDa [Vespa velutina]
MSAVININHPKLSSKPPIKKYPPGRMNPKEMATGVIFEERNDLDDSYHPIESSDFVDNAETTVSETDKCVNDVKMKMRSLEISDCNQNLIEPNNSSFEQLCKMINDLEGNIIEDVPGSRHFDAASITDNRGEVPSLNMRYSNQLEPEKDHCKDKCGSIGATYEDIMSFLATLEDGITRIREKKRKKLLFLPTTFHREYYCTFQCLYLRCIHFIIIIFQQTQIAFVDYPNEVHANRTEPVTSAIIQDIFIKDKFSSYLDHNKCDPLRNYFSNAFKDDLSTAQLQLEEKEATIKLLKNELKNEREAACEKLNVENKKHVSRLETQEKKYQTIVKRHQKFMEKLISEKTDLTDKCNSLAQRIKEIESKAEKDMKVCTDRHLVELQRAKEHFAASEKIRRERWLEARTSKIKEMTVKGLEPELRSMVEQHQLEIQEIRSTHIKELQDSELRIIRRSNQQLEQLRLELTASHEKVLASEKNILWTRYKEKLEEQEEQFRTERIKFAEDLERERNRFDEELAKRDMEKDTIIRQTYTRLQKELEDEKLKHQAEKEALRESLQMEWTEWLENYKKQQIIKLEKSENKIREESQRERDRQIELAIGRLEKEARDMKTVVQQSYESKLRSVKEKYEMELHIATDNEKIHKQALISMENKLAQTENRLKTMKNKLEECVNNLSNKNVLIETLTAERDNAKGIARREIEGEKRVLEDKIASLFQELTQNNANKEMLMSQLYSRVKLIITQKVLTIKNLSKELEGVNAKCGHLEKLLDQQRKEYILKSL